MPFCDGNWIRSKEVYTINIWYDLWQNFQLRPLGLCIAWATQLYLCLTSCLFLRRIPTRPGLMTPTSVPQRCWAVANFLLLHKKCFHHPTPCPNPSQVTHLRCTICGTHVLLPWLFTPYSRFAHRHISVPTDSLCRKQCCPVLSVLASLL